MLRWSFLFPFNGFLTLLGTWQVSHNAHPSNVALIARAILAHDAKGTEQLVYYQKGVGTNPCKVQQLIGAGTGEVQSTTICILIVGDK